MKPILITVTLIFVFFFALKKNSTDELDVDNTNKAVKLTKTIEVECAVPVNGMIRGNLPPCDMFPSKNKKKKKFKEPYVVDDKAYKSFSDFRDQMVMKENAERAAYADYREGYQKQLNEYHDNINEIKYASTRAKVKARDAKNAAYLAKIKETEVLREKGSKAKSHVVACKNSSGETYYANNCEIGIGKGG
ncbi:MAG: hypothetical protein V3U71_12595 [Cocleimonas sp.]